MSIVKVIRHSISSGGDTLSSEGTIKAKEHGRSLRGKYPNYKIVAVSSKARRAKQTAELIMDSAGIEPGQVIDERLSYSYTEEEIKRIAATIDLGFSPLEASIREARDTLYRDIIKVAEFVDQYATEPANEVIYVGVTHSPTIEGIEYIVTGYEELKKEPENLQGFTVKDGYFIPDRAISCDSLAEMCRSRWELISDGCD
jgi:broad specificity phosphatase PhoE